jgi:hypothetical protein
MSKVFGYYKEDENGVGLDKCWFDSSNVKYCECVDKEGERKTLRVVFNNGSQYEYTGVDVSQYLLFREDASQGKALNKYIKGNKYEFKKLEDRDLSLLTEECDFRKNGGLYVFCDDTKFTIMDSFDNVLYENVPGFYDGVVDIICDILVSLGNKIKLNGKNYEA